MGLSLNLEATWVKARYVHSNLKLPELTQLKNEVIDLTRTDDFKRIDKKTQTAWMELLNFIKGKEDIDIRVIKKLEEFKNAPPEKKNMGSGFFESFKYIFGKKADGEPYELYELLFGENWREEAKLSTQRLIDNGELDFYLLDRNFRYSNQGNT